MSYLHNLSEGTISKSSQTKKHHATMKLIDEEIRTLQQEHLNLNLDKELYRLVHERLNIRQKLFVYTIDL